MFLMALKSNRSRAAAVMVVLVLANVIAWVMTWRASSGYAFLLGSGWLAYSFGLRHAVDADHISAIDNVTRKLSSEGKRPVGVGLFFSLGHSTVVVLLCAGFALSATFIQSHLKHWAFYGNIFGTVVSGLFLYIIGLINLLILIDLYKGYRASSSRDEPQESSGRQVLPSGLLGRALKPVLRLVTSSWQMYLVGFLFGLGFDTATEVGILAISARTANHGIAFGVVMLLPLLFTAGMCFVDTLDGILMASAYGWAVLSPIRQFRYNFTITLVSILVAFFIGTYELVQLIADQLALHNSIQRLMDSIDIDWLGAGIVLIFATVWAVAAYGAKKRPTTGWPAA